MPKSNAAVQNSNETKPSLLEQAKTIATSETSKQFAQAVAMGAGAALGMIAVGAIHTALSN